MKLRFISLNVVEQCRSYKVNLWACPQFLFILMGCIIIIAMVVTTIVARQFSDDPGVVISAVTVMTVMLLLLEHAIVASFERLADASRMKSEFVSIVSHQLRSPLSAIKWQLEILLEEQKRQSSGLDKETKSTFANVKEQNERMIHLVNDLLEVNRIEDNRLILRPTILALNQVVSDIVRDYTPLAEGSGMKISFDVTGKPFWVFVDESKMRWVTENLIDNALRYSDKGRGEIKVRMARTDGYVRCEVADEGIGISIGDQSKIFQKFFRAESALKLRTEGSGLGLFLVKALVRAMDGKVGFASIESKGSTFWFTLPLVQRQQEAEINTKQ